MSAFSNYLETQIANYHKATNMPTAPTVRLALFDGNPGEAGASASEVSGTISARQNVTFGAPSAKAITNTADVDFGTSGGACTVAGFQLMDAASGGNALLYGATTSKSVNTADPVKVLTGDLDVSISGTATETLANIVLNWLRGTAAAAAPASLYVRLWDGDPDGSGTDVTNTIRAAGGVAITFGTVTDGAFSNSAAVDFGTADGAADVTHFTINTAADGTGAEWHVAALTSSKNVNGGDPVNFPIGALTVAIS